MRVAGPRSRSASILALLHVAQGDRARTELLLLDEPKREPPAQVREQLRPVTDDDRVYDELVLVDQTEIRQRQGELRTADEEAVAGLLFELSDGLLEVAA